METTAQLHSGPCVICGGIDYPLSVGGPEICPSCDCGGSGMVTVGRQGQIICELRARLLIAERLNRVDAALARCLSECLRENNQLRKQLEKDQPR